MESLLPVPLALTDHIHIRYQRVRPTQQADSLNRIGSACSRLTHASGFHIRCSPGDPMSVSGRARLILLTRRPFALDLEVGLGSTWTARLAYAGLAPIIPSQNNMTAADQALLAGNEWAE